MLQKESTSVLSGKKRLGLYVFYEKHGQLRRWNRFYLEALSECVDDVVVLVNGALDSDGRRYLESKNFGIFERDNRGFDFAAWRDYLQESGRDAVTAYDELVLCNCSCYGPVRPFAEVFSKMDEVSCDFWGLYDHAAVEGRFPHHLQSYFLVLRKRVLISRAFWHYWEECKDAVTWQDAVDQETGFTVYFEKYGFISASFLDRTLGFWVDDPTVPFARPMLEQGFPLIKRKVFTAKSDYILSLTDGSQTIDTLDFVREKTSYPPDLILEDLVHTVENSDLRNTLHLMYAVEDRGEKPAVHSPQKEEKIAAVVYSYYEDLIGYNLAYLRSLPPGSDVFVVVVSDKLKTCWERIKGSLEGMNLFVRKQENRGRNEAAYWLTCRDVVEQYDYICLVHDKKTPSAKPPIRAYYFSRHCFDGVLKSSAYVAGILQLFRENPRLGLLMPPTPMGFGMLVPNKEWLANLDMGKKLHRDLELTVPFDQHPDAPWGAMFWIRGGVMKAFYRRQWTLKDFPEEPIKQSDGTILHALERMYPMIAQESGYMSGWVIPASQVGVHADSLYYRLKEKAVERKQKEQPVHFKDIGRVIRKYVKRKLGIAKKR